MKHLVMYETFSFGVTTPNLSFYLINKGAPTAWCMQICPPNEEKWVLCASKPEDYQSWCIILEKFVKEKAVFIPDSGGMPPVNYASDDEGYRSSASFVSGGSTPEAFSRAKSLSDPKNPNASILAKTISRGVHHDDFFLFFLFLLYVHTVILIYVTCFYSCTYSYSYNYSYSC